MRCTSINYIDVYSHARLLFEWKLSEEFIFSISYSRCKFIRLRRVVRLLLRCADDVLLWRKLNVLLQLQDEFILLLESGASHLFAFGRSGVRGKQPGKENPTAFWNYFMTFSIYIEILHEWMVSGYPRLGFYHRQVVLMLNVFLFSGGRGR